MLEKVDPLKGPITRPVVSVKKTAQSNAGRTEAAAGKVKSTASSIPSTEFV